MKVCLLMCLDVIDFACGANYWKRAVRQNIISKFGWDEDTFGERRRLMSKADKQQRNGASDAHQPWRDDRVPLSHFLSP